MNSNLQCIFFWNISDFVLLAKFVFLSSYKVKVDFIQTSHKFFHSTTLYLYHKEHLGMVHSKHKFVGWKDMNQSMVSSNSRLLNNTIIKVPIVCLKYTQRTVD